MWEALLFGEPFFYVFYFFFITAFIGWIYESCFVSVKEHKLTNRGFLNGPVIPIYGGAGTAIMLATNPFKENYFLVFLSGMIVASLFEFITSWVMEKLFHAKWWDYSNWKPNIQGRVCLWASLFWGFLSVTMQMFIKPALDKIIYKIPMQGGKIAAYFIFMIFMSDTVYTVICTIQFDKKIAELRKIRDEFTEYIQHTHVYEELSEAKERIKTSELIKSITERTEELLPNLPNINEKLDAFKKSYIENANKFNYVQKRLINAFPDIKFTELDDELKDWLNTKIDNRIEKRNER